MSDSRPTHPRKGREGKGVGREWKKLIHASRLTSPDPSLWITSDRNVPDAWMALRAIGGGW